MRQHPAQFPRPTLKQFLGHSPDRCRGSRDTQGGQLRTPRPDHTTGRKQHRDWLVESQSPACRWRLSPSSLPVGRWSLEFPYPEPSRAYSELRPSRQIAAPGMRFPNPSSTGYCRPSSEPRLETPPVTVCWGPTAALPLRPPALCLANSCSDPSTAEAG